MSTLLDPKEGQEQEATQEKATEETQAATEEAKEEGQGDLVD
jgi:hypothetical protein